MLDGLKKTIDGISEMVEPLNPMVTNMTEKNQEIATLLLEHRYTVKEIQDFVDVSRAQLDEFISVEAKVMERMKAKRVRKAS